ncbi:MAG: F0F1 ATP synthase subunit A [Verrucomicrobiota bacterium]
MVIIAAHSLKASALGPFEFFTNSTLFTLIVVGLMVLFVKLALNKVSIIPTRLQNFVEWVIELLYDMLEGIVGKHMIKKAFPLLSTVFLFILVANWSALVPGVGTVGFGEVRGEEFRIPEPLLRPSNADLNTTLSIALLFMVVWFWWSIQEVGWGGFLKHIFAPKGLDALTGVLKLFLTPLLVLVFLGVGLIEVVSIAFRPVSLSLRLYGNIFAGENLLWGMGGLGDTIGLEGNGAFIVSMLGSMPFYGMELLIGLIQAMVFMLLCAVYIKLSTTHDEH